MVSQESDLGFPAVSVGSAFVVVVHELIISNHLSQYVDTDAGLMPCAFILSDPPVVTN